MSLSKEKTLVSKTLVRCTNFSRHALSIYRPIKPNSHVSCNECYIPSRYTILGC